MFSGAPKVRRGGRALARRAAPAVSGRGRGQGGSFPEPAARQKRTPGAGAGGGRDLAGVGRARLGGACGAQRDDAPPAGKDGFTTPRLANGYTSPEDSGPKTPQGDGSESGT